ncbi:HlyD family type I secretion periplasmic adaptor subunit [Rhodobacteraceae bacterium HSP-20]|uniref:Membrane fusion protein (MFP) family protein n=1 Tax=Paragemmobacter amnigenus TaxID=2852097 RepID=A0ABS6J4S2_9RHOB|nr:HlyD family type I secretion periplasmic adaptor subunit [Rhodobacter amnigenus]MBU9698754.1 HlyD family type I secretion periplasmic adaptor subunit [Rhodobacter amnigenus]MBV4389981.1 HlyD family type I secretion periplasmic adaptor subunit [Rhodobacter amnigenus]
MTPTATFPQVTTDLSSGFALKPRLVAAGALAAFLVGGIGLWSATARIDAAIIGAGSVLVKSDLQNVQHVEGGTLRSILVQEGEQVVAGQPVLMLETFDLDTQIAMIASQLAEAEARAARLSAERDGGVMASPSAGIQDDPVALHVYEGERRLMEENRITQEAERMALGLQADQLRFEREGMLAQLAALEGELALVAASHERFTSLLENGAIEKSRVDEVQREVTRLQGEIGSIRAGLARTEARQTELALQMDRLLSAARADAHRDLRALEPQITELRQQLAAARQKKERAILRAPSAGIVNEVNVATIGEVVPPGKTLVSIVPVASDLVIEFRIATTDIDAIRPGQKARLRFPAFNQRLTPEIEGVVESIGAAAVTDPQTGMSYYAARAKATDDLGLLGDRGLVHGMPVEVYVPTAERVVISYLVQPVVDQMNRAMREE